MLDAAQSEYLHVISAAALVSANSGNRRSPADVVQKLVAEQLPDSSLGHLRVLMREGAVLSLEGDGANAEFVFNPVLV